MELNLLGGSFFFLLWREAVCLPTDTTFDQAHAGGPRQRLAASLPSSPSTPVPTHLPAGV